jgi:hypothetical protein
MKISRGGLSSVHARVPALCSVVEGAKFNDNIIECTATHSTIAMLHDAIIIVGIPLLTPNRRDSKSTIIGATMAGATGPSTSLHTLLVPAPVLPEHNSSHP